MRPGGHRCAVATSMHFTAVLELFKVLILGGAELRACDRLSRRLPIVLGAGAPESAARIILQLHRDRPSVLLRFTEILAAHCTLDTARRTVSRRYVSDAVCDAHPDKKFILAE